MKLKRYLFLLGVIAFGAGCSPKTKPTHDTPPAPTTPTTPLKVNFLTNREADMVAELNLVRSNPKGYIPIVEAYIRAVEKDQSWGEDYVREEVKTAKELMEELKKTPAMGGLQPHEGLQKAAQKHGEEGKKKGSLSHTGSDGSMPWDRAKKTSSEVKNVSENLVGGMEDVRESVLTLLVDSGVEGRGHRRNILEPSFRFVACFEVGQVGEMPYYWIQMFGN